MRRLPIIALTAKAMKGDPKNASTPVHRTTCKPVNTEQLLSVLRTWLIDETSEMPVSSDPSTSSSSTTSPESADVRSDLAGTAARTWSRSRPATKALQHLLKTEFAVVLLDVCMPTSMASNWRR